MSGGYQAQGWGGQEAAAFGGSRAQGPGAISFEGGHVNVSYNGGLHLQGGVGGAYSHRGSTVGALSQVQGPTAGQGAFPIQGGYVQQQIPGWVSNQQPVLTREQTATMPLPGPGYIVYGARGLQQPGIASPSLNQDANQRYSQTNQGANQHYSQINHMSRSTSHVQNLNKASLQVPNQGYNQGSHEMNLKRGGNPLQSGTGALASNARLEMALGASQNRNVWPGLENSRQGQGGGGIHPPCQTAQVNTQQNGNPSITVGSQPRLADLTLLEGAPITWPNEGQNEQAMTLAAEIIDILGQEAGRREDGSIEEQARPSEAEVRIGEGIVQGQGNGGQEDGSDGFTEIEAFLESLGPMNEGGAVAVTEDLNAGSTSAPSNDFHSLMQELREEAALESGA
jgi:hypothetical protein